MDDYRREVSRATVWITRIALALGCLLSIYLTIASLKQGQVYGCIGEPACYLPLRTRWGHWFGLPIGVPGAVAYGILFILSTQIKAYTTEIASPQVRSGFVFLAALTAFVGAWLLVVQIGLMRAICPYCVLVNLCGILVMILYISWFLRNYASSLWALLAMVLVMSGHFIGFSEPVPGGSGKPKPTKTAPAQVADPVDEFLGSIASIAVSPEAGKVQEKDVREPVFDTVGLTVTKVQEIGLNDKVILPPAPVLTPPQVFDEMVDGDGTMGTRVQRTHYELAEGKIRLKVGTVPVIGLTNATHVIGLMYDYTYTNSVTMYRMMDQAVKRYRGQVAVVLIPVPMDKDCNDWVVYTKDPQTNSCEYCTFSSLVWRQRPDTYLAFESYLTKTTPPPPVYQVEGVVLKLLGEKIFNSSFNQDDAYRSLRKNVALYRKLELGSVPKLISRKRVALGVTPIAEDLYNYLENLLLLDPPGEGEKP